MSLKVSPELVKEWHKEFSSLWLENLRMTVVYQRVDTGFF